MRLQAACLLALLSTSLTAPAGSPYLPLPGSAWRLALGDIDADGRNEVICGFFEGRIGAVDPATGASAWTAELPGFPFAVAAVDATGDGRSESFAACADGSIQAFSPTGSLLWSHRPNNAAQYALAVLQPSADAAPVLLAGGLDRTLRALDPATGRLLSTLEFKFALNHLATGRLRPGAPPSVLALNVRDARYFVADWVDGRLVLTAERRFQPDRDVFHKQAMTFRSHSLVAVDFDGDGVDEIVFGSPYTHGNKILAHTATGAPLFMTDPWAGPDTPGLARKDSYNMTLVRAWTPSAHPKAPGVLAVTTGNLRLFDGQGRTLADASAPVGFTDLVVDGDTLYLASSPNGDRTLYRLDLSTDWTSTLASFQRQGLAQAIGQTLDTILTQALALPPAPGERHPVTLVTGRVTRENGWTSPMPRWISANYPYPQFTVLLRNPVSGMLSGPVEDVKLNTGGQEIGPNPDGHPRSYFVDLAREIEASGLDQTFYISHGATPRFTVDTLDAMLAAAPRHLAGFVTHEDEQEERIPTFVRDYLAPLARRCRERDARIFFVQKNVWWFDTPALEGVGPALFQPALAPALVAGVDDANSRTPELNLMGRFGLRQAGLVGHIMAGTINDLYSFTRMQEWEYPKHGHPFFRLLVATTALGADTVNFRGDLYREESFTELGHEAFDPFLHLLGKGWLFAPRPEQAVGTCPVGLVIHTPPEPWIADAHNGHGNNDWTENTGLHDAVFPHNGAIWGLTPTPLHSFSAVLFRKSRQGLNHVPATPYGPVVMIPAFADRSMVPGVKLWWHTDGVHAWRDGGARLTGPAAAAALTQDLETLAHHLPFRPTGDDAFFHSIQVDPDTFRLVAVDPGWLDPADRHLLVRIQLPGTFIIRDLLTGQTLPLHDRAFALTIPAGAARLLTAQRVSPAVPPPPPR